MFPKQFVIHRNLHFLVQSFSHIVIIHIFNSNTRIFAMIDYVTPGLHVVFN